MRALYRLFAVVFIAALASSGLVADPVRPVEAAEVSTSAGFVSGQWRVVAQQTFIAPEFVEGQLTKRSDGVHAVVILDVTNLGATGVFEPTALTLGAVTDSPLSMTAGTAADGPATVRTTQALKLEGISPEGTFIVAENSSVRFAAVFPLAEAPTGKELLALRLDAEVISIENTMVDAYSASDLPPFAAPMALEQATISTVPGGSNIQITTTSGETKAVKLAGVDTPKLNACYGAESAAALTQMTGGTVWLEKNPDTSSYLVWANNAAAGTFVLVNHDLISQGAAGSNNEASPYASWFEATTDYAKGTGAGLWDLCKNAKGAWINPPTPTPVPTKTAEEIRADYVWVDVRDLLIRPGNFEGDKIAVSGSVFNIMVEGNFTFMQIWVNGGNYDAVSVVFQGDSTGIYEGTWITVYGKGDGTYEGTNLYGGPITQPLIRADIVDR